MNSTEVLKDVKLLLHAMIDSGNAPVSPEVIFRYIVLKEKQNEETNSEQNHQGGA